MSLRSDGPLDFTTFGELSSIINANRPHFAEDLESVPAATRHLRDLNSWRGTIAHSCPLEDLEEQRLDVAIRSWERLLG